MNVEEYVYNHDGDRFNVSDDRAEELTKKLKDQIRKGFIAHYQILDIGKNDDEYEYIYYWLDKNNITIRGINISNDEISDISQKDDDFYKHIKRINKEKIPDVISKEEQMDLFIKLQQFTNHDKKINPKTRKYNNPDYELIRNRLIIANMRLVNWISNNKRYKGYGVEQEDIESYGYLGLIRAVELYDPSRGYQFSTYAVKSISRRIFRELFYSERKSKYSFINEDQLEVISQIESEMLSKIDRKPSVDELFDIMGIPKEKIKELLKLRALKQAESLENIVERVQGLDESDELLFDSKRSNDGTYDIEDGVYLDIKGEVPRSENSTYQDATIEMFKDDLNKVLKTLTPREEKVLRLRVGLEDGKSRTLDELAEIFNVTRERIRQIEAKALRKLRHPSRSKQLIDYIYDDGGQILY